MAPKVCCAAKGAVAKNSPKTKPARHFRSQETFGILTSFLPERKNEISLVSHPLQPVVKEKSIRHRLLMEARVQAL
jgi:hypothetical protein